MINEVSTDKIINLDTDQPLYIRLNSDIIKIEKGVFTGEYQEVWITTEKFTVVIEEGGCIRVEV